MLQFRVYKHAVCITIGHGLVVRHFRESEECGGLEELKPIDENRNYDFNYQQTTILPRPVQVLPVSSCCNIFLKAGSIPCLHYYRETNFFWSAFIELLIPHTME